jgi:hypothetical protein
MALSSIPEQLTAVLAGQIRAYKPGDPGLVLDARAAAEVRNLLSRAVGADGRLPLDVVRAVVSWLAFSRQLAPPEGEHQYDLRVAVESFAAVTEVEPQVLLDGVRRFLAATGQGR